MVSSPKVLLVGRKLQRALGLERARVLLEPENLATVLDHYGLGPAEVKRRAADGTIPGELLLELVDTHGADAVWSVLSPGQRALPDLDPNPVDVPRRFWVSLVLTTLGAALAAIPILDGQGWWIHALPPALILGALGGGIGWNLEHRVRGVIAGALTVLGAGAAAALGAWLTLPLHRFTLLAAVIVGGFPGSVLGLSLYFTQRRREAHTPESF